MRSALLLFALLIPLTGGSVTTIPLGLAKLVEAATTIIEVTVQQHRNGTALNGKMAATITDFSVARVLKGESRSSYQLVQYGMIGVDQHGVARRDSVISYRIGERYLLFLPTPSRLGFAAPIAMHQGNFLIREVAGIDYAGSGVSKTQLVSDLPPLLSDRLEREAVNFQARGDWFKLDSLLLVIEQLL